MEEMIDVLDENTGDLVGETISKSEVHRIGKWHGSIHILIVNKDKTKTLLQKRCEQKKLYPNMWDIAVGGHISAGETALNSAQRELKEELGLDFNDFDIKEVEAKWCSREELNQLIQKQLILPHVREYEILNQLLETK